MKRVIAAALLCAALGSGDASAKCALMVLDDTVVTNQADTIPGGAGVLVSWTQVSDHGGSLSRDQDPTLHDDWRFREKKKRMRAKATALAPGLSVYVPAVSRNKKHTVTLSDTQGNVIGTYKIAKGVKKVNGDAPAVKGAIRTERQDRRSHSVHIDVVLEAPPPAGAYGLIAYQGDTPVSWDDIEDPAATTQSAYASPGRCGVDPPGMSPPAVGDSVTFAWVDRFGQLSLRSAAVTVNKP